MWQLDPYRTSEPYRSNSIYEYGLSRASRPDLKPSLDSPCPHSERTAAGRCDLDLSARSCPVAATAVRPHIGSASAVARKPSIGRKPNAVTGDHDRMIGPARVHGAAPIANELAAGNDRTDATTALAIRGRSEKGPRPIKTSTNTTTCRLARP